VSTATAVKAGAVATAGILAAWLASRSNTEQDPESADEAPADESTGTPANPDGSAKERGQQYEEVSRAQRDVRRRGQPDQMQSTRKSRQRDRQEIREEAERALRGRRDP
jgi:hypothetical protein